MNPIHRFLALLAWLQILASPTLLGVGLGTFLWLKIGGVGGTTAGVLSLLAGMGAGIWLAEKARRSTGTIELMARNIGNPELPQEEK